MRKTKVMLAGLALLLIGGVFPIIGCKGDTIEYKKYAMSDGIANFTFEYPSDYKIILNSFQGSTAEVNLEYISESDVKYNKLVLITVTKDGMANLLSGDNIIKEEIADLQDIFTDFILIQSGRVKFLGTDGSQYKCTYTYDSMCPECTDTSATDNLVTYRRAGAVVCNGIAVHVTIMSEINERKNADYVFTHLLQTFKIMK
ncbi:MAG: hypothetical protein JW856_04210 [Dehalococcoidales bacterium]|nr:hypothetical protein [Dehalococcoidales bacterium]